MQVTALEASRSAVSVGSESPTLSFVVPTFNEATNLPSLFEHLLDFVRESGVYAETIIVDDSSPDGTGILAEELAVRHNGTLRARVLHRPAKLGLSSALLDGVRASQGMWVAILDADNSHDISSLGEMMRVAEAGADVVIGSRYVEGSRIEAWPPHRRLISLAATFLTRAAFRRGVRDPMSGFALFRRDRLVRLPDLLNPRAYKFLLEVLVRLRPLEVREVPITFRNRRNGDSKLTPLEIVEFLKLILLLVIRPEPRPAEAENAPRPSRPHDGSGRSALPDSTANIGMR